MTNSMVPPNQILRLRPPWTLRVIPTACVLAVLNLIVLPAGNVLTADDWPQINGLQRNGVAQNETLIQDWPSSGLKEIWTHPIGQGFAGPAVAEGRLIVFHRPVKEYLVEALDAETGKLIWNRKLPSVYNGGMDGDRGPKCTPVIHDGHVYLSGTGGNLFCLDFETGAVVWTKNPSTDYGSPGGFFGAGSTPIVVGDNLLLNVGGEDAAVVAFDLKTGAEKWKSFDDRASYSSPIAMEMGGKAVAVFITRVHLIGLDSATGKLMFEAAFGKTGTTVNGAMPFHFSMDGEKFLFATAAYGIGAKLWKVDGGSLEEKWANDDSFSSQFSTPVFYDGFLFGTAGRRDHNDGSFRCVEALTGKVQWERARIPVGHSILVNDKIVVLDTSGGFHVISAKKTFERTYTTQLFDSQAFAMPALANGLFYARSNVDRSTRQGELVCVEVGVRKK